MGTVVLICVAVGFINRSQPSNDTVAHGRLNVLWEQYLQPLSEVSPNLHMGDAELHTVTSGALQARLNLWLFWPASVVYVARPVELV